MRLAIFFYFNRIPHHKSQKSLDENKKGKVIKLLRKVVVDIIEDNRGKSEKVSIRRLYLKIKEKVWK